jgi:hypothetical protein
MSTLNLVPWRERHRRAVLQRWQWGVVLSVVLSLGLAFIIDQALADHNQAHETRMVAWQAQQQALQSQLRDAALWQTRERQARQLQNTWPHWQQLQAQGWLAFISLLSASPQGVQLSHAEWHDGQWRLQAHAFSQLQLQSWMTQLQSQGISLQMSAIPSSARGWRCPQGRMWRLLTYDLHSLPAEGARS